MITKIFCFFSFEGCVHAVSEIYVLLLKHKAEKLVHMHDEYQMGVCYFHLTNAIMTGA